MAKLPKKLSVIPIINVRNNANYYDDDSEHNNGHWFMFTAVPHQNAE